MIMDVLRDMRSFLILLVYTSCCFSILFHILTYDEDTSIFIESIKTGFLLGLGEFIEDGFTKECWVIFTIAAIINLIVMMNLLIAIISDTFD